MPVPLPAPADEQVQELARAILARSQYARWHSHGGWLFGFLRDLERQLQALANLADTRPVLFAVILTALLVVAAALLAHVVYSVRVALRATRPPAAAPRPPEQPRFVEEADALAAAGRPLDAAHHLQLAVLALLLRRRVLELGRGEPNRTLRRRLRAAAIPDTERREILGLLDRFEARWFRDRTEDPDLYRGWRQLYLRLERVWGPA
jgi:hypothetical protein